MNADARKQRKIEEVKRIDGPPWILWTESSKRVRVRCVSAEFATLPIHIFSYIEDEFHPRPYLIDSDGVPPKPGEFE